MARALLRMRGRALRATIRGELHVHEEQRSRGEHGGGLRLVLLGRDERAEVVHTAELILHATTRLERAREVIRAELGCQEPSPS